MDDEYGFVEKYTPLYSDLETIIEEVYDELEERSEQVAEMGIEYLKYKPLILIINNNRDAMKSLGANKAVMEKYKKIIGQYKNLKVCIIFNDVDVLGMTKEGSHPFILDTGACVSIFRQNICTHAQYAYRREYYYPSLGRTLSSDFMFFALTQKCQLKIIAGASIDNDLNNQLDFLGVDGELCFNDFEYDILSIDIKNKQILWK